MTVRDGLRPAVGMHWAHWAGPLVASLAIATSTTDALATSISDNVRPDFYATNGSVSSVVQSGNTLYIAGSFTAVGPPSGGGVPVDAANGSVPAVFPRVGGTVYAVIPDGNGGWYIGGSFKNVGGQPRSGLAHILSDGSVAEWNPVPNDWVFALALDDGILYVGGYFTAIDGQSRYRLASFDLASGQLLPWTPYFNYSAVNSLAVSDGKLYVGGGFWMINGVTRNGLACFDTQTGTLTGWDPNASSGASFYTIVVSGSTVYVRGTFQSIGGQVHTYIAALDANTAALRPWNPAPNGYVSSLAMRAGLIYIGGGFTSVGGQLRNGIAAVDSATGGATAWNPNANSQVNSLVPSATAIYAGGWFTTIGGQARAGMAALDPTTGQATPWTPAYNGSGAQVMALSGNTLYVGVDGGFAILAPQPRNRLAAIDIHTGAPTSWNPAADGQVITLLLDGGTLYAGGSFHVVGGQTRNYLAAFDVATGNLTSWNPSANSWVSKMSRNSSRLYVGGSFTQIDGNPRSNLASFDLATGALNSFSPPASSNSLIAFAPSDNQVFVARAVCTHAMNTCLYSISWSALDATIGANTGWTTGVTQTNSLNPAGVVLMTQGDQLLIGGDYITYGGRSNLISVSQATGALTSWNPSIAGPYATVTAFGASGNTVFVAGTFTNIGGHARNGLAALDATTAEVSSWYPAGGGGNSLAATDSSMFVGGGFTSFGPDARMGLAAFGDPTPIADSYLETPLNMTVDAGTSSPPVYGRAEIPGVTSQSGFTNGLAAQVGYGPDFTDPATNSNWVWFNASYDSEEGTSDRFVASVTAGSPGVYDYCYRYSFYGGAWVYADADGSGNGYSQDLAGTLMVAPLTSVGSNPTEMALAIIGANPAQRNVRFRMELPAAANVRLSIHDVSGRKVATIVDGARSAGRHELTWAAGERSGISPGIYFARMSVLDRVIVRRLVLLR